MDSQDEQNVFTHYPFYPVYPCHFTELAVSTTNLKSRFVEPRNWSHCMDSQDEQDSSYV